MGGSVRSGRWGWVQVDCRDPVPARDLDEAGVRWRVTLDPEGNEFCLVFDG